MNKIQLNFLKRQIKLELTPPEPETRPPEPGQIMKTKPEESKCFL